MSAKPRAILTDAQLRAEVERCQYCATKPCQDACPASCSPADFIMAVRVGAPADFGRAAAAILAANPLGEVCGEVCPDTHCQAACSRAAFDTPVDIPALQATIVHRARELGSFLPGQYPPHGHHELLNWHVLAGAMGTLQRKPEILDYVETFIFQSDKCFAVFPPN